MRKILFVLLFIFLIACKLEIEQTVENTSNISNKIGADVSEINKVFDNSIKLNKTNNNQNEAEIKSEPAESQKYSILNPTQNNASISSDIPAKKWIKGITHIIEVIDVTENSDACIIRVDNSTDLINVGETKTLNGVKIFVSDVIIFNSLTEDKDICELVIA